MNLFHRALRRALVMTALCTIGLVATSASALAAGTAWGVTATTSSSGPAFTEGDGVQNLSSFTNNDSYSVTVTNNGDTASSGTATVTLNFQGTGVSLKDILPNVPSATGTVTSGSTCVTAVTVTTGPFVTGQPVSGTGIPSGSTVVGVNDSTCGANSLDVSAAATTTGTGRTVTEPATAQTPTGSGWTCTNASTPTCTRSDSLAPGNAYPAISFPVQVSATAGVGTATGTAPMHVAASTTASGGGATSSPIVTTVTPVDGEPDLTVTNTPSGAFRQGDAHDSYKIVVVNQGGGATSSGSGTPPTSPIVVTATAPAGETPLSLSGSGWTCSLAATVAGVAGAVYTEPANSCYRTDSWGYAAELPPITLAVSVAANATTPETESASVSGGGELVAPISVSAATVIQQSADLTLALSHTGSFNQGDSADSYSLVVSNVVGPNSVGGGASLGQVVVSDTAPAGETITGLAGQGWTCSLSPVVVVVGTPNLVLPADTCARSDALAVNASYPPITATVAVANGAGSPELASATVSGGGMSAASTAGGGQTATDSTVVNTEADLTVLTAISTGSTSDTFTQGDGAGQNDMMLVEVANEGFAATSGTVTVTDTLPAGLTPGSPTGSGWTCSAAAQIVTCTRSDALTAGAAYSTISIPLTVTDDAPSSATNDVSVAGGGEINSANNAYHQPIDVTQLPDLVSVLTDNGPFTRGAVGDTYSIGVTNQALVPTSGLVTATATLGSGVTPTAISGSGWSCDLPSLTCTRSDALGPNGVYPTITVTVNVASGAPSSITSSVTVSGGGEVDTADDTAADTTATLAPGAMTAPALQITAMASADAAAGSGSQAPGGSSGGLSGSSGAKPAIAKARGFSVRASRVRHTYLVTGKLVLPASVSRSRGCRGTVTVQVMRGKRRLARRTTRLTPTCTYSVSAPLSKHGTTQKLTVIAGFHGNNEVAQTTAKQS